MRGFFVVTYNFDDGNKNTLGVLKKVSSQFDIFCKYFDIELLQSNFKKNIARKLISRLPFTPNCWDIEYSKRFSSCDFIYIRSQSLDMFFIRFLKKLKNNVDACKVIVEIPTYPYNANRREYPISAVPVVIKDRIARRHMHKYVDAIVSFSKDTTIWNVPVVSLANGYSVSKTKKKEVCSDGVSINLIGVAGFSDAVAYERIIYGIEAYVQNGGMRQIVFHIVGDGKHFKEWEKITRSLNLTDKVIFYGYKTDEELDEIYDICDIGVENLGAHRIGISVTSSLKSREYLAKGLPMITACEVDILDSNDFQYFCRFPSDDSPIDIEKLIAFYDRVYTENRKSKQEIIDEIREFALKTCDMEVTMQPIIDYIDGKYVLPKY